MITVFPALTSSTVNPNALPGICKALEKFVIIYRMDSIINVGSAIQKGQKSMMMLSGVNYEVVDPILVEDEKTFFPSSSDPSRRRIAGEPPKEGEYPGRGKKPPEGSPEWLAQQKELKDYEAEIRGKGSKEIEIAKKELDVWANDINKYVDVKTPRFDSALSVEPTYVQVDRPFFGSSVIGVKVIPFQVKSDKKLINLITHDRVSYGIEKLLISAKRSALSLYHGAVNKLHVPFLRGGSISGDVHRDILSASSIHWTHTFCILNYMDLGSDEFVNSPAGISKLHNMGWSSLVFADDVNKRAMFCMKEFNGLCSTVQYPYLFSSLGREHAQVYKDLEDIKASASPIFKMTTNLRRLASRSASEAIDRYLNDKISELLKD